MDNENKESFVIQALKEDKTYHFDIYPDETEKEIFGFDGKIKKIEANSITFDVVSWEGKGKERHQEKMILKVIVKEEETAK